MNKQSIRVRHKSFMLEITAFGFQMVVQSISFSLNNECLLTSISLLMIILMGDYFSIRQALEEASNQDQEKTFIKNQSILQLSKKGPLKLDASLTNWNNDLNKHSRFDKQYLRQKSPQYKNTTTLPRVYDYVNKSLPKINQGEGQQRRTQSYNAMNMNKHKGIADIRRINILGGVMPQEQKQKDYDLVPKMLKRMKVIRSKSRRNSYSSIENPQQFSLFSLNQKIKLLYKSPLKKGAVYYQNFIVSNSNLLNYNI